MYIEKTAMKNLKAQMKCIITAFKKQAGMALAETLVAIAILGVSGAAFASALSTGSLAVNNQDAIATAQALAQTQLEVVQNAVYDSSGASYPTITVPTNYSISMATSTSIYSNANIQKISVNISHNASPVFVLQGYKVNR
jgi:type II secretory pathway pseudopilin PulG